MREAEDLQREYFCILARIINRKKNVQILYNRLRKQETIKRRKDYTHDTVRFILEFI